MGANAPTAPTLTMPWLLNKFIFQIVQMAKDGLAFLDRRKVFWQQQEPVFARKLRTDIGNVVTLVE